MTWETSPLGSVVGPVALYVIADREGMLFRELGVHLSRPQNFIRGLVHSDRSIKWSKRGRRPLRHPLETAEPEDAILDKRPPYGETIFMLEERCTRTAADRCQVARAVEVVEWTTLSVIGQGRHRRPCKAAVKEEIRGAQVAAAKIRVPVAMNLVGS